MCTSTLPVLLLGLNLISPTADTTPWLQRLWWCSCHQSPNYRVSKTGPFQLMWPGTGIGTEADTTLAGTLADTLAGTTTQTISRACLTMACVILCSQVNTTACHALAAGAHLTPNASVRHALAAATAAARSVKPSHASHKPADCSKVAMQLALHAAIRCPCSIARHHNQPSVLDHNGCIVLESQVV